MKMKNLTNLKLYIISNCIMDTKIPMQVSYISYECLIKDVKCQDNKRIIEDILDGTPHVELLKDRSPIPLNFILLGKKKSNNKI